MNEPLNRDPPPPSDHLEIGLRGEFGDVTEAQIGHHRDVSRDLEELLHGCVVQNADPSYSDPFGSSGKPQILDRAAGTVQIRLAYRRATQDVRTASPMAAGHAQINRCFSDPFELETPVQGGSLPFIPPRGIGVRLGEQPLDRPLGRWFANHDEIPGLHVSDRPGMVSCSQQAGQDVIPNRRRQKIAPHVPSLKDGSIDRFPLRR